jgi:hypothetical protein
MYFKDNINIVPRTDLQVDGMEAMWFEIKSKVGNILLNIIYRSQIEAGSLFWRNFSQMVSSALDYSSKIISLGDYNIYFLGNLPTEIADIINVYGLENKICHPTRFGSNSYSLLDPILVSDSITVIESTTIQINRTISDHELTYIVVNCGYHNDTSFKRNVWLYNKGNYDLFKQRVEDTDWGGIINNQTDMDISCNLFTKKFMYTH